MSKAAATRETSSKIDSSDLPISTKVTVLGVEISIHAEAMHADMYEGGHSGGLDGDIKIQTWDGKRHICHPAIRKNLAYWARRNLFNGAGPQ